MTAEIAIVNRQGIALAADSAVTIGRAKVWKTANKLFSLEPVNDIAIMIYNTGDFVGIPWEVLVKVFREDVGKKVFLDVRECEAAFFNFLDKTILPASSESDMTIFLVILDAIENLAPSKKAKSLKELQAHIEAEIAENEKFIFDIPKLRDVIPSNVFLSKFKADIAVLCKESFGFRLTRPYFEKVHHHLYEVVSRTMASAFMSGVVFAGYGKDQLLPYVSHFLVDGRMKYHIGKVEKRQTRFWLENRFDLSEKDSPNAYVIPFAQSDIFYLFMEGITRSNIYFLTRQKA